MPTIVPYAFTHLEQVEDKADTTAIFPGLDNAKGVGGNEAWQRIKPTIENYLNAIRADWTGPTIRYWARRSRQFAFLDIHDWQR